MSISDTQKVDYLWKKIGYGRAKTDVNSVKDATNESISSPLLLRGDEIWAQSSLIPSSIPVSSSTIVTVYPTSGPVECTADITSSSNRTWATGTVDWIPPEIGSTYLIKVYLHTAGDAANAATSGTQIYAAGSGNNDEFFFDYKSGILNFIGTNLPSGISGKSVYISGARYTGVKGTTIPGSGASFSDISATNINVSGVVTASSFVGDGSSLTGIDATSLKDSEGNVIVQANESGVVVSGSTTATTFYGDGSNLTGITAAGTGAIGGLTIKNESGAVVGTAGSVSTVDFSGSSNISVTATSGTAGVATVTISPPPASDILSSLLTVDGSGTQLDADKLDGQEGSYYTTYADNAVSALVDSAPGTLNTLNELAAALGDDANFSTTVTNSIATKLPLAGGTMTGNITMSGSTTVDGRDLSVDGSKLDGIESGATGDQTAAEIRALVESASDSNVFTDADHTKLNGIASGATNVTNNNQLTNGAGYITSFDITTQTDSKYLRSNAADTATGTITFSGGTVTPNGNQSKWQVSSGNQTVSFDARTDGGTGARLHKWNSPNLAGGSYQPYQEAWYDGDSYHYLKVQSNTFRYDDNTVWHAGNDGSGSGLDADTVDGIQGSSIITNSSTQSSQIYIRNNNPTIFFRDTDNNSSMIHVNSNIFYVLRGGTDSTSWSQVNGAWPLEINLTNNDATFGRNLSARGNVTAYSSDKRLKENLKHIESPLDKVQKLNGYTFDWISGIEEVGFVPDHKKNDIGLIAQEVNDVLPQAVAPAPFDMLWDKDKMKNISKSGENYLTVQYERLVPLLVEAIKDQQEQINTLKEEIKSIKNKE